MTIYGPHVTISAGGVVTVRYMSKEEEAAWEADRQRRIQASNAASRQALEDAVVSLRGKVAEATAEGLTEAVGRYQAELDRARAELAEIR